MPHLSNFTVEAYYEDGAVQARVDIQAPDLIDALCRVHAHYAFAQGIYPPNSLNPHMAIGLTGGVLVPVMDVVAAARAPAMQVAA